MAIPKIKLYRLDENYSPESSVDLQAVNADEIYPFVPKDVSLNVYEELVGVTYRDLHIGSAGNLRTVQLEAVSGTTLEYEPVCCQGWCKGMISAIVTYTEGATETAFTLYSRSDGTNPANPDLEAALKFEFTQMDEYLAEDGFAYGSYDDIPDVDGEKIQFLNKVRRDYVKLSISEEWTRGKNIVNVSLAYRIFSSRLDAGGQGGLALERGNIYDGRSEGRLATASNALERDGSGKLAKKAEGNKGYRCKFYPLRQKVILQKNAGEYLQPTFSGWTGDMELPANGAFVLTDCETWISNLTDERRPRLFECLLIDGSQYLHELTQDEQYTVEYLPQADGTLNLKYQLSQSYYRAGAELHFPNEVVVRYNEEDDVLKDMAAVDYFDYDNASGDTGTLSNFRNGPSSMFFVRKRFNRMAMLSGGRDSDFTLTSSGSSFVVDLDEFSEYNDMDMNSLKIYVEGMPVYADGASVNDYTITIDDNSITVIPPAAGQPLTCIMVLYELEQTAWWPTTSAPGSPWSYGFRICCYEKTNSASLYVSSFRNWVCNHLNNNPDVFYGFQTYDGTLDSSKKTISHTDMNYSVLYREGAVLFSDKVPCTSLKEVKNFPPSGSSLTAASSDASAAPFVKKVFAKFAYYDGISDVTNGILREYSADQSGSKYAFFDADNPSETDDLTSKLEDMEDGEQKTQFQKYWSVEDKKWIIKDDTNLPTVFYSKNQYLPSPVSVEAAECNLFRAANPKNGECVSIDVSKQRDVAIFMPTENQACSFWLAVEQLSNNEYEIKENIPETTPYLFKYEKTNGIPHSDSNTGLASLSAVENGVETVLLNGLTPEISFDPELLLADNIEARQSAIFHDFKNILGYDIRFEIGEGYLVVTKQVTASV